MVPGDSTWPGRAVASRAGEDVEAAAVALARAGDTQGFRVLVERHSRKIYGLAYRLTGNHADAEDVVQETFLRAYRELGRFQSRASVGTWLHRIAVNCAVDAIRTRANREAFRADLGLIDALGHEPAAGDPGPERVVFSAELRRRVMEALDELTPKERAAFVLRHFEGWSIAEIGRTLRLRTNATKHSIFRAVRKMRATLEPFVAPKRPDDLSKAGQTGNRESRVP